MAYYEHKDQSIVVRVKGTGAEILRNWVNLTNQPIGEVASQMISYAACHAKLGPVMHHVYELKFEDEVEKNEKG